MYPSIAKAAHIIGKVTLRVTVKDGLVVKTDVTSMLRTASWAPSRASPKAVCPFAWTMAAPCSSIQLGKLCIGMRFS